MTSPGEIQPLVSSENEDYECTAKYSHIDSGAFGWAIGNCPKGLTLEAVVRRLHSDSEPEGDYALGGWIGGAFQGCGWIEYDKFKPKPIKTKPTTACSEITSGKYEIAESNFIAKHNSGVGDGYFVVNQAPCPEYANYRPWSSSNLEQEKIRTEPAYATQEPGSNIPALKWRYTSKYNSTDGTGQYVMVRDASVSLKEEHEKTYGQGNWVFVPRSCLPTVLPESENERVPLPPTATTDEASSIATPVATLNATVDPNGLDTHYYFEYGPTTSYGISTSIEDAGAGTANVQVSAAISGLAPGTTYYFRIVATSATGTTYGGPVPFVTQPPPTVITATEPQVAEEQATISGTVNPHGLDAQYHFKYGETEAYGSSTPTGDAGSGTSAVQETATITELQPGKTYHYRLVATSSAGSASGKDATFITTSPVQRGVSCASVSACQGVGTYSVGSQSWTLGQRWNGGAWVTPATYYPSGEHSELNSVSCVSASWCMGVGSYGSGSTRYTLAEYWNGSEWLHLSSYYPPEGEHSELLSVSCTSTSFCQAVGTYVVGSKSYTLGEKWNGTEWVHLSTYYPPEGEQSKLYGVSCVSASWCMSVGTYGSGGSVRYTLAEYWNGSARGCIV